MANIISKNYNTFVNQRLVNDNTNKAYETFHLLKNLKKYKTGLCLY